jgi:hypothetical protein
MNSNEIYLYKLWAYRAKLEFDHKELAMNNFLNGYKLVIMFVCFLDKW